MSAIDQLADSTPDVRTRAWQAAKELIRNHGPLQDLNAVWQTPEDAQFNDPPPEDVLTIKLWPTFENLDPIATNGRGRTVNQADVILNVMIAPPGNRAETSHAVWREILSALRGDHLDNATRLAFREVLRDHDGIHDVIPTKNADSLAGDTVGEGTIRLVCFLTI